MMTEYLELVKEAEEFSEKADAYDTDEMSPADLKYYMEVTTRCTEKMLEVY